MNKVLNKLPALIEEELQAAMDEHGDFHSFHEGYAVLLEEVDEVEFAYNRVRCLMRLLWDYVRNDDDGQAVRMAQEILKEAQCAAAEAIQVAAMAQKIIRFGDEHEG